MPVVPRGSLLGAVELAAGSPLTAPRPLGEPAGCADAAAIETTKPVANSRISFTANSQVVALNPQEVRSVPNTLQAEEGSMTSSSTTPQKRFEE